MPKQLGRYIICDAIASGGMATVHLGRLVGALGFTRTVAIKRLHKNLARDPELSAMLLDEARLTGRIRHANVVSTLDAVALEGEILIVMEYIHGESLAHLLRDSGTERPSLSVIASIALDILGGLHAAHEATGPDGKPLALVHRDVSPHNVLVGTDGIARVLDFGVAKARHRIRTTRDGRIKGKLPYMAPEQLLGGPVDRRADIYAAGIIFWELLTNRRLFGDRNGAASVSRVARGRMPAPSEVVPEVPPEVDEIVLRALASEPSDRFDTAQQMATALERVVPRAGPAAVGEWVEAVCGPSLSSRAELVRRIETGASAAGELHATETVTLNGARSRWPQVAIAVAVVLLAGVAFALARKPAAAPAAEDPPRLPAASQAPIPTEEQQHSAPDRTPDPNAAAAPDSMGATEVHRRPRHRASAPASSHGGCNPPYAIDPNGVRRYLVACLRPDGGS